MQIGIMVHRGHSELISLEERLTSHSFVKIDNISELDEIVDFLDAVVASSSRYTHKVAERLMTRGKRIRLVQSAAAGYENFVRYGIPEGAVFANASGIWAVPVAEHVLALLLGLLRACPQLERNRATLNWGREEIADTVRSLDGATVAVVGIGSIGQEVARRLQLFQARVIGVNRNAKPTTEIPNVLPISRIGDALAQADAVVICLASTPETQNLFDAEMIRKIKPGAILVNVARGDIISQPALAEALTSGHLGGAGLDVFSSEPLPPEDPLWRLNNVILSPHVAGYGGRSFQRVANLLAENLDRLQHGQRLVNQIDLV